MKLYLVFMLCCAVTIFAAPVKDEGKTDDVKAKGKISVEVKPIDLQVKLNPVKFQAKVGERKSIVTTSTTTEPTTIEPTEDDESNDEPQKNEQAVKPLRAVKPTAAAKKNDKTEQKPIKAVESSTKKDAASVVITERPVPRKVVQKVEEPKSRFPARGRSRFRSGNIEETEQQDKKEPEAKDKLEKKEEPKSTKRDKIKLENAEVKEKKNEVKKVEKVDKKTEQKEKEIKEEEDEEEVEEEEEKPKPWKTSSVKKLQQKVAAAKTDAEKWKQDKFEPKWKSSSKSDKTDSNEPKPEESDEKDDPEKKDKFESKRKSSSKSDKTNSNDPKPEESDEKDDPEKKKSRSGHPSAEDRRKGRKYHDIQIVQLESEIEEDGKYRYNYEGEDGTHVEQEGELKRMNEEDMGESVKGSYSYKDDEGKTFSISYTADENGYRPVGDHIPTIPPAIARALAWAATAKPWVDPWLVQQERLKASRESRKLSKKDQKKNNNRAAPVSRDADEYDEIEDIDSQ